MYTFVIHIIQVLFPGKDTQALIDVWWGNVEKTGRLVSRIVVGMGNGAE
jgi:hypothetical protein